MKNIYDELKQYNSEQPNDGVIFYALSDDQMPDSLEVRARARKREDEQRRHRLNLSHFDDQEFKQLMTLWSFTQPTKINHDVEGIHLETQGGDTIHVRRDKVSVNHNASDETLKALVLHAKQHWNNGLRPLFDGNEEQKARVWAHCQVHGVNFDWQPSPEMVAKMAPLIGSLRAKEGTSIQPTARKSMIGGGTADNAQSAPQPMKRRERYQPPRNAVAEMFADATPEMRKAMREPLEEIRKQNPIGDWPYEPYHYGMGRIMAYEMWLERLSEEDLKKERAAARARYEAHYDREATQLSAKMKELGYNVRPPRQQEESPARENDHAPVSAPRKQDIDTDVRPGDVPVLAGESKAAMRGRVQHEALRDLMDGGLAREISRGASTRSRSNGRGGMSLG